MGRGQRQTAIDQDKPRHCNGEAHCLCSVRSHIVLHLERRYFRLAGGDTINKKNERLLDSGGEPERALDKTYQQALGQWSAQVISMSWARRFFRIVAIMKGAKISTFQVRARLQRNDTREIAADSHCMAR